VLQAPIIVLSGHIADPAHLADAHSVLQKRIGQRQLSAVLRSALP
jgi:hypothetical protein